MRTVYIFAMMLVFLNTPAIASQSMPERVLCMALNIYHEARNQSLLGQVAVANVTLNRVRSEKFPDTICEVVYQKHQFSWYWDGKSDQPIEKEAWETAKLVARAVLSKESAIVDNTGGALFYHANYVRPHWSFVFRRVREIETHIFYASN